MAPAEDLVGKTLSGRYHLLRKVAGGGMGSIYLAERLGSGERAAIKVLHPDRQERAVLAKRFMREAQISSLLHHPNTISVYSYDQDPETGAIYLVMEYLDGRTLFTFVRDSGRLAPDVATQIALQILASLGDAHEKGVVHRDLKPGNVMVVERPGRPLLVKVLDFGLAKVYDPGALPLQQRLTVLTQLGEILGTPHYMSPEQVRGDPLGAPADLYALAVILFFMLTGIRPFEGKKDIQVALSQLKLPFPQLAHAAPGVGFSPALQEVIDRASRKDPRERFQRAREFAEALCRAVPLDVAPSASRPYPALSALSLPLPALGGRRPPPASALEETSEVGGPLDTLPEEPILTNDFEDDTRTEVSTPPRPRPEKEPRGAPDPALTTLRDPDPIEE
jgi:serine/threonine-protein kinase